MKLNFPALNAPQTSQAGGPTTGLMTRIDWQTILTGVALWLSFAVLLAIIQFASPNLAGNDDYFHIRFAQVMREEGLRPPFPWLPLTILNETDFYDHHFLYHVLLVPFTFGNILTGAKIAGVIFPATAFFMGWVLLRGQKVPYATLWALGIFAVSEAFLDRMVMIRVQSVSLLMLLLILHMLLQGRYRWLLPLAFVYTWLYDAFPILLSIIGIYVIMRWLLDNRFDLWPLLYTILGVILGLVVNPYFPNDIYFIYKHIAPKLFDITDADINVGNEWYPYETWTIVENSGLALLAFAAGTFGLGFRRERMDTPAAVLWGVAILFGLLFFKSRRFVEYFPAFALLFCAVAWQPIMTDWLKRYAIVAIILPATMIVVIAPAIWFNVQEVRDELIDSTPYQRFGQASAWLKANTPPGSRVFNTDWDDFTWLFFHNTHNTYMHGLDPTYMYEYNPELYLLWRSITRGEVPNPGQTIYNTFGASYVITDLNHDRFLGLARSDPSMQEVYRDDYAAIFIVTGAVG